MKVELKKIEYSERMSEETNAFVADLYINGKRVGYAKNDGRGGCNDYRGNTKEDNQVIAEAEAYFKTLPKVRDEQYNFEYQPTLETAIDDAFEQWLKNKHEKKRQKLMETAILVGKPNGSNYIYFKQRCNLADLPPNILQPFIDKIKAEHCTEGNEILNTNLEAIGIKV